MNIVFGLWADGRAVPEHGAAGPAAAGSPVLGPLGLLDALETMLGFGSPQTAEVERIAAWQSKLETVDGGRFWTRSFEADPWTTARRVLEMRDGLMAGGWDAAAQWIAPRLVDLAAAESAGDVAPKGVADRLDELVREIDDRVGTVLSEVRLIELRADLPPGWRRLSITGYGPNRVSLSDSVY